MSEALLMEIVTIALSVTIYEMSTVETCLTLTLTFGMTQDEI